jgi:hypothetical protein
MQVVNVRNNYKLLIGVVFNTNLCQHHAKILFSSSRRPFFIVAVLIHSLAVLILTAAV